MSEAASAWARRGTLREAECSPAADLCREHPTAALQKTESEVGPPFGRHAEHSVQRILQWNCWKLFTSRHVFAQMSTTSSAKLSHRFLNHSNV